MGDEAKRRRLHVEQLVRILKVDCIIAKPIPPVALVISLRERPCQRGHMLYHPNYAGALRCIGQALLKQDIEVFELKSDANELRVEGADPNPPYTNLIKLNFSSDDIKILDREGQALRRRSKSEFRFDSLPEILRAVGKYVDDKRGVELRRLSNCNLSDQERTRLPNPIGMVTR